MVDGFAETDAGIDDNLRAVDTGGEGEFYAFGEELFHLADDVGIGGIGLQLKALINRLKSQNF